MKTWRSPAKPKPVVTNTPVPPWRVGGRGSSGSARNLADWQLRGEVLASAREAASMSREQLAVAVRVADEYRVELWEQGVERPQARVIPMLAANLGLEPLSLLDGDPDHPDLTHLRVAAGMSLTDMAKRVGLPLTSYHRLERRGTSRRGLAEGTAKAIAAVLEIPLERVEQLVAPRRT